jgi:hypothetical protein
MSYTSKVLLIVLFFILLMPFGLTQSFAYGHGGGGFHGGGRYHGYGGYGNFGLGFSYSPYYDNYYYPYYPSYYDTGVLVSSPVLVTPEVIVQPSTIITTASTYPTSEISPVQITPTEMNDDITLNIPNATGGYSAVLIKKSGKGFIGPQGEFYSEFPKVSILEVLYGK